MGQYELDLIDHTYAIPVETMRIAFPHLTPALESESQVAASTSQEQTD